jgi:hypothetical protein
MLLHFGAKGVAGGVLGLIEREVLPRWKAGEIINPIAYLRKILSDSGDRDRSPFGVFRRIVSREHTEPSSQLNHLVGRMMSGHPALQSQIAKASEKDRGCLAESIVRIAASAPSAAPPVAVPDAENVRRLQEQSAANREAAGLRAREQAERLRIRERADQARREKEGFLVQCDPILRELNDLAKGKPERIRAIRAIVYPNGLGEAFYDDTTADRLHTLAGTYRAVNESGPPQGAREEEIGADATRVASR